MNRIVFIVIALIFTVTFSSCATSSAVQNSENNVAGYTLKNKKELMHQKVLNKKVKTVIAMP